MFRHTGSSTRGAEGREKPTCRLRQASKIFEIQGEAVFGDWWISTIGLSPPDGSHLPMPTPLVRTFIGSARGLR